MLSKRQLEEIGHRIAVCDKMNGAHLLQAEVDRKILYEHLVEVRALSKLMQQERAYIGAVKSKVKEP